jgi:hypothetical protein
MCDEAAEVATHDAVPCWALSLVELVVGHSMLAFLAVRVSTIRSLSKSVKECVMVSYCFLDHLGNVLSRVARQLDSPPLMDPAANGIPVALISLEDRIRAEPLRG